MTDKPDYANMTDVELTLEIARRLGYRFEPDVIPGRPGMAVEEYKITFPDGSVCWATPPYLAKIIPNWPGSVDAALKLPLPSDLPLRMGYKDNLHDGWWVMYPTGAEDVPCGIWSTFVYEDGDDFARVLCLAWLAYMDEAQEE